MKNIFTSATKIVLLLFALTACVGFLWGKLSPELFASAMGGVFGFFFANKGDVSEPYLGK
jgi:ABC-type polysaccharide/polyol phosphate export permease